MRSTIRRTFLPFLALGALLVSSPSHATQITVDTVVDADVTDGHCSLREAIQAANTDAVRHECPAGNGADQIRFSGVSLILLAADLPTVTGPLLVSGPNGGLVTIDGGGAFRPFTVDSATDTFELRRMRLLRGHSTTSGGCLAVPSGLEALTLTDSRFEECSSDANGGAIDVFAGSATVIARSTFVDNSAAQSGGGARLWNFGAASIEDSTFSGNAAAPTGSSSGGGLVVAGVDLEMRRTTISGNVAGNLGGAMTVSGFSTTFLDSVTVTANTAGAGVFTGGCAVAASTANTEVTVVNSVFAGNLDASQTAPQGIDFCLTGATPAVVVSLGFNLLGSNDGAETAFPASPAAGLPNANGDFVGSAAAPIDARLGPLAPHGGPTWTHEPRSGSPLLDQGSCPGELADQRGWYELDSGNRIVDDGAIADFADGCDIGAVEFGATSAAGALFADGMETESLAAWSSTTP